LATAVGKAVDLADKYLRAYEAMTVRWQNLKAFVESQAKEESTCHTMAGVGSCGGARRVLSKIEQLESGAAE
jgi:hypothetical protein